MIRSKRFGEQASPCLQHRRLWRVAMLWMVAATLVLGSLPDFAASKVTVTKDRKQREIVTCDSEESMFTFLHLAAAFTPYKRISRMPGGDRYTFKTSDEIMLSGVKLTSETPAKAYLLIIQGNGFPIGRVIQFFEPLRQLGIDIYGFDFRGYKRSKGTSRFWAILQDYAEIIGYLDQRYEKRFIYATSFGGVIAANLISDYENYDLVLFDTVISRVSKIFSCDRNYDPVDNLPDTCSSLYVQANGDDRFFKSGHLDDLMTKVQECGGRAAVREESGHPFEGSERDAQVRVDDIKRLVEAEL